MRRCDQIHEQLLLDLACADAAQVRLHLADCRQCAGFVEDLRALEDLTRELTETAGMAPAPRELRNEVMSRLPRHRLARNVVGYALIPALLGAAVFAFDSWSGGEEVPVSGEVVAVADDPLEAPEETSGRDYVDVVIEDPVRGKVIVRVPAVIQLQRASEAKDFYVHKVSF